MTSTTSSPFQVGVPVPALLWDTFEEALRVNVRRLAKDIAGTLGTSDVPLLDALFKGPKGSVRPYLFEDDPATAAEQEVDMRCRHMCQRPDAPAILQSCGRPIVWATGAGSKHRCAEHLYAAPPASQKMAALPVLIPLEAAGISDAASGPLFRSTDGTVYDSDYRACGSYDLETKVLMLFQVSPDG